MSEGMARVLFSWGVIAPERADECKRFQPPWASDKTDQGGDRRDRQAIRPVMPAKTMTPKPSRLLSLEAATFAYLLVWIPYIALTKGMSSLSQPGLGRPMTGLEILPISIILIW